MIEKGSAKSLNVRAAALGLEPSIKDRSLTLLLWLILFYCVGLKEIPDET